MLSNQIPVDKFPTLRKAALTFPAIDNHAHPLLREQNKADLPYEGVISEANGPALNDAPHTLACLRATPQLAKLLGLPESATWEEVKAARAKYNYQELCDKSFKDTAIETILIDDDLDDHGVVYDIPWHDQFTKSKSRRIVRVEVVAEVWFIASSLNTDLMASAKAHFEKAPLTTSHDRYPECCAYPQ